MYYFHRPIIKSLISYS